MKETINRKYLAILALAAAAILFVGGRFRPRPAEAAPSPTETAMLEQSVRRDQAAGIGQYLASRAAELGDQAVFLPSHGLSGVRYGSSSKVLTVDGSGELTGPGLVMAETSPGVDPAPAVTSQRSSDNWVLIVGRTANGQLLWTAVIQGTEKTANCNDVTYQEVVVNLTLDRSFAGAGAFDLDGNLTGIVAPCGGSLHIVSVASVPDLLARSGWQERDFVEKYGFRAAPLAADWQDLYPGFNGLMVTDVWLERWADRNGLLPGDLIITEERMLQEAMMGIEFRTVRPGRPGTGRVNSESAGPDTGIQILPASAPLPELMIAHGSAAERAGLRSGDRLVSILGMPNASVSTLSKALGAPGGRPVRIVYERGKKRSLVEVSHE